MGICIIFLGLSDYENDGYCGFEIVEVREIDIIGMEGIIKKIREWVGMKNFVYLSLDIDMFDLVFVFVMGMFEMGGWSMRELRIILRGLEGVNLVGVDIVEVVVSFFLIWLW